MSEFCECGCGNLVKKEKSNFLQGHYWKLKENRIKASIRISEDWKNEKHGHFMTQTAEHAFKRTHNQLGKKNPKHSALMKARFLSGELIMPEQDFSWTKYGIRKDLGHNCRSSWEANFERILKFKNIEYIYEIERISLINNKTYMPDFYLPRWDLYIEIKGNWIGDSKEKCELFKSMGNKLLIIDKSRYLKLVKRFKYLIKEWE